MSKAEQDDYLSFIGFMIYYMHRLHPPPMPMKQPVATRSNPELHDLSPIPSQGLPPLRPDTQTSPASLGDPASTSSRPWIVVQNEEIDRPNTKPRLLLAGYSYGAMVTASLPPIISSIVAPFQNPLPGSSHAEIRLRAECLAAQQNGLTSAQVRSLSSAQSHRRGQSPHADDILYSPKLRKASGGVRMGGEEDLRRASHDLTSRRSFDFYASENIRKSVDRVRSIGKSKRTASKSIAVQGSSASSRESGKSIGHESQSSLEQKSETEKVDGKTCKEVPGIVDGLQTAYLLVSPLQGLVHNLVNMFSTTSRAGKDHISDNEIKFTVDPTLALFGDDDLFVSVKKLRAWAAKLAGAGKEGGTETFRYVEVAGAGHFWHDYQAVQFLQEEVRTFVKHL